MALRHRVPVRVRRRLRTVQMHRRHAARSYSQFGEDSVLQTYFFEKAWSAYTRQHSRPPTRRDAVSIEQGFYVDVGAFAPVAYSNTYWAYQLGWRGIVIDPAPGTKATFSLIRPRDVCLEVAISRAEGAATLYTWGAPFVDNTLSEAAAREREKRHGRPPVTVDVECRRLDSVLTEHLQGEPDEIALLTVDVEDRDHDVLASNDWRRFRPELVVAELGEGHIEDVLRSDVHGLMLAEGYELYAWAPPSLVFRDAAR